MAMETLSEAMTRLVQDGYTEDVSAHDDGKLHCSGCHSACDATNIGIDHVVRFEGDSNPDDEAVLFALDCGAHKSLYAVAFDPKLRPTTSPLFGPSPSVTATPPARSSGRS